MTLRIRNWDRWQSYRRDRGQPPWIKVHRRLMSNAGWAALTDAQKGQMVQIWLLAADRDGEIPDEPKVLQKLCMLDSEPNLEVFAKQGFISGWRQGDVNVTPERRQHDAPEAETEAETEAEADCFPSANATGKSAPPRKNGADGTPFPPVPFEKIQTDYNDLASDVGLPQCRILTATRKKHISARWREYPDHDSWDAFWGFVRKQPFLTGQNDRGWRCDLEWLMKPSNFAKVCEGSYLR